MGLGTKVMFLSRVSKAAGWDSTVTGRVILTDDRLSFPAQYNPRMDLDLVTLATVTQHWTRPVALW